MVIPNPTATSFSNWRQVQFYTCQPDAALYLAECGKGRSNLLFQTNNGKSGMLYTEIYDPD